MKGSFGGTPADRVSLTKKDAPQEGGVSPNSNNELERLNDTPGNTSKAVQKKVTGHQLSQMFSKEFRDLIQKAKDAEKDLHDTKLKILNNRAKYCNNIFYVTFRTKRIHEEVLNHFGSSENYCSRLHRVVNRKSFQSSNNKKVTFRMKAAPEPADIIWSNLSATNCQKICYRILTFFITAILVGIGFGIVLGLKYEQYELSKNVETNASLLSSSALKFRGISVAISMVIVFINTLLPMIMRSLTNLEKQTSTTDYFESLTIKIAMVTSTNEGPVHQYQPGHCHHPRHHHVS